MLEPLVRQATCRLCEGDSLSLVFSLEPTPPANAFVSEDQKNIPQELFPLDIFFCEDCAHVQLLDVVDPHVLFENYIYVSGTSPVFVKHFQDYASDVITRFSPSSKNLVVDIGSNDGTLLHFFQDVGYPVLGIDPAKDIAASATAAGIETLSGFFTIAMARSIRSERGTAAVRTANNVFAHIDDLKSVTAGIRDLLDAEGIFVFEVSYLVDVYEGTLFDMMYHEHLAYHSVKPLIRFFEANGMEMIEALRVDSHGGSLRGVVQRKGGPKAIGASVERAVSIEESLGLDKAETLRALARNIDSLKHELGDILRNLKAEGKTIAGFGAPAKATTLMYHFGIGADVIDFIVDDSPLKQGLYTPGMHIPVLGSDAIADRKPDALVILAWNFAKPIIAKHEAFRAAGGKFIVPLPKVEII